MWRGINLANQVNLAVLNLSDVLNNLETDDDLLDPSTHPIDGQRSRHSALQPWEKLLLWLASLKSGEQWGTE